MWGELFPRAEVLGSVWAMCGWPLGQSDKAGPVIPPHMRTGSTNTAGPGQQGPFKVVCLKCVRTCLLLHTEVLRAHAPHQVRTSNPEDLCLLGQCESTGKNWGILLAIYPIHCVTLTG